MENIMQEITKLRRKWNFYKLTNGYEFLDDLLTLLQLEKGRERAVDVQTSSPLKLFNITHKQAKLLSPRFMTFREIYLATFI